MKYPSMIAKIWNSLALPNDMASLYNHSVMNTSDSEDSEAFYRGKPCNAFSLFGGGPSDFSRLCMTSSNVIKRA